MSFNALRLRAAGGLLAGLVLLSAVSGAEASTRAPSPPTRLVASSQTLTRVVLRWRASTSRHVVGYRVYVNRRRVGHTARTSFAVAPLRCGGGYAFAVRAVDARGRVSAPASVRSWTTACANDRRAPSTPTGLTVTDQTQTSLHLSWTPSVDNVGVAAYRVYRDGVRIARTTSPSIVVSGLTCGSTSTYAVAAVDAAGNVSPRASVAGSTAPCPGTPPCSGVDVTPASDLEALAAANSAGTIFCLAPGVYRIAHEIKPNDGQQFIGTGPGVVITGGTRLTSFTQTGTTWTASGTTTTPAIDPGSGFADYLYAQAPYADDVTIDGAHLEKVGVMSGGRLYGSPAAAVGPGQYFVDYDTGAVVLGSDPAGHDVEMATATNGFRGGADGVVLRDLTLQLFTNDGVDMEADAAGWTIDHVDVSAAHDTGIKLSDDAVLTKSSSTESGRYGVNAHGSNITVDGIDVSGSDAARYYSASGGCVAAGGSKFVKTVGLVLRNSDFHDNRCPGIWFDVDTYDSTVENNVSVRNEGDGIRFEVSHKAVVRGNTSSSNGGRGIYISCTQDVDVSGNTTAGNTVGAIQLNWSGRTTPTSAYGSYATSNVYVHANTMILSSADQHVGIYDTTGTGSAYSAAANNRFDANTYRLPDSTARYFHLATGMAWADWRAAGMDPGYTLLIG